MDKNDKKYILRRVITFLLIYLIIHFMSGCTVVHAEIKDCDQIVRLNQRAVTKNNTTTLASGVNYQLTVVEPGVIGNDIDVGYNFYTDIEFVSNLAFGNYTATDNGSAYQILDLGYKSNALGFGTQDGVYRIRILWTGQDIIDRPDGTSNVYAYTINNYGGSRNYQGGMRLLNVTCGYQSDMPTNGESDAALLKSFSDLQNGINTSNQKLDEVKSAMQAVEGAVNNSTQVISNSMSNVEGSVNYQTEQMTSSDTSGANSEVTRMFGDIRPSDSGGLSSIITAPLRLINKLNNTCTPLSIPLPMYNINADIPCMSSSYIKYLGNTNYNLIKELINTVFVYGCLVLLFIKTKELKEPEEDKIEVVFL